MSDRLLEIVGTGKAREIIFRARISKEEEEMLEWLATNLRVSKSALVRALIQHEYEKRKET